jgi:predicted CoA-binding protein
VAGHSSQETIRELLTETRTWAVVGCSPDPGRDSNRIARLLVVMDRCPAIELPRLTLS